MVPRTTGFGNRDRFELNGKIGLVHPHIRLRSELLSNEFNELFSCRRIRSRRNVPCLIPGAFAIRQQNQTPRGIRREGEGVLHRVIDKPTRFRALGQFVEHQNVGNAG